MARGYGDIEVIFAFYWLLAVAFLLACAFIFAALFSWWADSAKRKARDKHLRNHVAARELARYHHLTEHKCGLVGETNLVHIDARCVAWTVKVERYAKELRAAKVRRALEELDQKKTARVLARAADSQPLN